MPTLVAVPDKFRGTASAGEIAEAAGIAARRQGWQSLAVPIADGGEGLLELMAGERRRVTVSGPLGEPVEAEWCRRDDTAHTAVIEMALASGLVLAGGAEGNDAERASTRGTGELVVRALAEGSRRIVVGCGGSATTDGGAGALAAIEEAGGLAGAELVVAVDVQTRFVDAARVFGPQKGASAAQVERLSARLESLAVRYRDRYGVDVANLDGSGAAGGLSGALAAIGGRIVSGFELVAELVGLDGHLAAADLVLTGEGRLDATSFAGKVVGEVLRRCIGRRAVLCVVGAVAPGLALPDGITVVSLSDRYGERRSLATPGALVTEVVEEHLRRY